MHSGVVGGKRAQGQTMDQTMRGLGISQQWGPMSCVDGFGWMSFGLCTHGPIQNEPKDGLRIVIEFVPPRTTSAIQRRLKQCIDTLSRKLLLPFRVARSVEIRDVGYRRNDALCEWHCVAKFY